MLSVDRTSGVTNIILPLLYVYKLHVSAYTFQLMSYSLVLCVCLRASARVSRERRLLLHAYQLNELE